MRRFADSEWHSHNEIEFQTHPVTILGLESSSVGSLNLRNANHEQLIPNSHPKHDCEITQHIWRQLHTIMKSWDFGGEDHVGCLKDPRQQSTKVEKSKNIDHEVSKTSKIIQNGSLSMILHAFEHGNKYQKK